MPATLSPVIYGDKKNIDFNKFNIGDVIKSISGDLEEFGEKGVQGVAVKTTDATRMIKHHSGSRNLKEPYLMAGLCKKDLVLVVRDKKDAKFEAMSVLVKNYDGIKKQLAKSSASVVNLDKGDSTIDKASKSQAKKFKTKAKDEDSADFGGITGNILLCAHGTPKVKPGRVVGVELAGKSPKQICDILTENKDESKRIAKGYSGKITLSGCYTASGGPEKDKQDDAFAKKVWGELKKRGYTKCSVVGMPGPTWTVNSTDRDEYGSDMKRGDKGVWAKSKRELQAQEKKAEVLRKEIDSMTEKVLAAWEKFQKKGSSDDFLRNKKVKEQLTKIQAKVKSLESVKEEIERIQKDMDDTGASNGKGMKALTGTFGLRLIKAKVK